MKRKKEVSLLAIIRHGRLALENKVHQGQPALFCPGVMKGEVANLARGLVGETLVPRMEKFGNAVDLIIRTDDEVELFMEVFRIVIPDTIEVRLPEGFAWYSEAAISKDPRCRRDRRLYTRLLGKSPLNVTYSEEQLGDWADAKIIAWQENPV